MEIQTLSLAMSQHLSSLAPGFGGHWVYVYWGTSKTTSIYCRSAWGITAFPENGDKIICPAWQVEDVLRNLEKILCVSGAVGTRLSPAFNEIGAMITLKLFLYPDTAYQKIEEYLWTVLKQPKGEECAKAHCKCIQTDCSNHHYVDDK